MVSCEICGKKEEDTVLYDGVYDGKISKVCYSCSLAENIALVKKPTQKQLEDAQKRLSVKELMEKLSSPQQKLMMKDQSIAHKNLVKIKFPAMKQEHGDLVENYDWLLKQGRRRMKLSTSQVAQQIGFDRKLIESLEAGQLFNEFEKIASALEKLYGVKVLKSNVLKTRIVKTPEEKKEEEEKIVEHAIVSTPEKKSWFSFFKGNKEKVLAESESVSEKEKAFLEGQIPEEETIAPVSVADVHIEVKEKEMSPWMAAREKQRSASPQEVRHEQVKQRVSQMNQISHEKIDMDDIRKERREQLAKNIEADSFDFSRRENLDKLTLQDLAELKRKKENKT